MRWRVILFLGGVGLAGAAFADDFQTTPDLIESAGAVADYEAEVRRLEQEGGPFDARLAEPLISIGLAHRVDGRHTDALDAFRRALHVIRANAGLHHPSQLDVLDLVIESNRAINDWQALDANYQQLYWIHRRNYGARDPRLLPVIARIVDARLHAYRSEPGERPQQHLIKAEDLNADAFAILERHGGENDQQYIDACHRAAVINYHLATDATDLHVHIHDLRSAYIENGRGILATVEPQVRAELEERGFLRGENAVQKLRAFMEPRRDQAPEAYAEALIFEGDYYLVFRRNWDAMRSYREAWEFLAQRDTSQAVFDRLFGAPRRLEPLMMPSEEDRPPDFGGPWVEALIDVPDSGWPANIRLQSVSPEGSQRYLKRGRYAVAGIHYRPRFENGDPVGTENVAVRYYFER